MDLSPSDRDLDCERSLLHATVTGQQLSRTHSARNGPAHRSCDYMKWVLVPSQQSLKADVTWTERFIFYKADCRTVFAGAHHVRLNRCHSQLPRLPPPPHQVTHRLTGLWQWQNRLKLHLVRPAVEFSRMLKTCLLIHLKPMLWNLCAPHKCEVHVHGPCQWPSGTVLPSSTLLTTGPLRTCVISMLLQC